MYEVVGGNAIVSDLEGKVKVAKVPIDSKWYEKLLFGDYTRINEDLARRVPGFFDDSVYLPRIFAPGAEELELLMDGGRSGINLGKHTTLDLFNVRQTYAEKRKGVGTNNLGLKNMLADEELKKYLEDRDLLVINISAGFNRPCGVQSKGLALNELEKSRLLERLNVKHTPVLAVFPFPKGTEKRAKELTENYFGNTVIHDRLKKTRYYQEIILFPGNIRVPTATNKYEDFVGILKELGVDLNKFSKELEKDFLHFLEIAPKTLTESTDGYTFLGFRNWSFSDCILAPTGLYVTDLESVGFYRIKKNYLTSDLSTIRYLDSFWNVMRNAAYRHLPEKNNDEIVEGLIDTLNTSKYFDVELKGKEQPGDVDRYLLNFRMDCKSGIGVDFNEYVSLKSSS